MVTLRAHHLRMLYDYAIRQNSPYLTELKDKRIIESAIEDGKSKKHGQNTIKVMKSALSPSETIILTDSLDDICQTCRYKTKKACREFIEYEISAASDDRATAHYYSLNLGKEYKSSILIQRLLKTGQF